MLIAEVETIYEVIGFAVTTYYAMKNARSGRRSGDFEARS